MPDTRKSKNVAAPSKSLLPPRTPTIDGGVIGRRDKRRLEVALYPGSLTDVSSRAYVLGIFTGVAPAGAARAVDRLMGNILSDYVQRRMIGGNLGEIFIVPKGRSFVPTDQVIFVGLGSFDRFTPTFRAGPGHSETMRLICESVIRTCLHCNIEEFATVLLGGSTAETTEQAVGIFAQSFLTALETVDSQQTLRKITLCETDPARVGEIRDALARLATTEPFAHVELELRELPPTPSPLILSPTARRKKIQKRDTAVGRRSIPIYLIARMYETGAPVVEPGRKESTDSSHDGITIETSILTPRSKAALLTARHQTTLAAKEALLAPLQQNTFSIAQLEKMGERVAEFVFDQKMQDALAELSRQDPELPLVVVHDAVASQLPWETLKVKHWRPAIAGGMTRQYLDANLSVAKWLEQRLTGKTLEVLLIANPTDDLLGAQEEGSRVRAALQKSPQIRLTERLGIQATREQLLSDFRSGQFDVVHYAGHAFFDPVHPGRAGLLCAGEEVLSGADLADLSGLPALVFFNACESARIRGNRKVAAIEKTKTGKRERMEKNISLANAFISGGVANFLGTYWPVGDWAAKIFSATLYPLLLKGHTIGESVLSARRAVKQSQSIDWADYILFGNPDFTLKQTNY